MRILCGLVLIKNKRSALVELYIKISSAMAMDREDGITESNFILKIKTCPSVTQQLYNVGNSTADTRTAVIWDTDTMY